jgi:hypothetical protein
MFRSAIALALSLFLVAEASAQTTPAAAAKKEARAVKKATKASARATRKSTKQADRLAKKTESAKKSVALADDGWPPLAANETAVASVEAVDSNQAPAYGETAVHNRHEDVVYAAPGMAVHVNSKKLVPYSVRPPRKPATTQTTLGGN